MSENHQTTDDFTKYKTEREAIQYAKTYLNLVFFKTRVGLGQNESFWEGTTDSTDIW